MVVNWVKTALVTEKGKAISLGDVAGETVVSFYQPPKSENNK